jgi:hypothetical protein
MGEFKAVGVEFVQIHLTRLESMTLGARRLKEVVHALGADGVGIGSCDFGADSSRPAFSLCTLLPTGRPTNSNTCY